MKVIFHLDLDSYFISAQRTVDPSLIGKSIVISMGKRRSIVSAVSYEAKAKGIHVPMPFYRALELDPNVKVIKSNFALYTVLSTKLFEFISNKYTKNIEVASIDECYIDVSDIWQKYGSPIALAKKMQKDIMDELKLPASIGISDNKFVAKMSTSINKPYGITITKPGEFLKVFGDWPLIKYHGIGLPTAKKLNDFGIKTIKDLAKADVEVIKTKLGIIANNLIQQANGKGSQELDLSHNQVKGIGNAVTFQDYDRETRRDILKDLHTLCEMVSTRAKNRNLVGSVVSVAFKTQGGNEIKKIVKQKTLDIPINKLEDIFNVAVELFDKIWDENTIKYLDISLNKLSNMFEATYQTNIFEKEDKKTKSQKIVEKINNKFKSKIVKTGKEFKQDLRKNQNQSKYIESDKVVKYYNK